MLALKRSYSHEDTINKLSALLRARYLRGRLTAQQAEAFATFSNPEAQDTLFKQLGSLAQDPDILMAITRGDTVLPIKDDFLILPSRKHPLEKL